MENNEEFILADRNQDREFRLIKGGIFAAVLVLFPLAFMAPKCVVEEVAHEKEAAIRLAEEETKRLEMNNAALVECVKRAPVQECEHALFPDRPVFRSDAAEVELQTLRAAKEAEHRDKVDAALQRCVVKGHIVDNDCPREIRWTLGEPK